MYGTTEQIDVLFKMFVCTNHLPTFEDENEAVFNRFKQIQMCSHFDSKRTTDNPEKLEWIGDAGLGDKLSAEYSNEIIHLVLTYAQNYYKKGIPTVPTEFLEAGNKTKLANNEFATWFYDTFEVGADYKCLAEDVMAIGFRSKETKKEASKKEIKVLMAKMDFEYKKDRHIRTTEDGENKVGGWQGFRILKEDK
jgi:phage/plasmid-associated DNA primase